MGNILVLGGAGYIGSVCVKELLNNGHKVIVVDNLSKGIKNLVDSRAEFFKMDTKDDLSEVFNKKIDGVIHFAAYKAVGESMENAVKYSDNITGTINVLNHMVKYGVKKIIFSSTAAVYGDPSYVPMDEKHPTIPVNFYGYTKLQCEKLIEWYSKVYGINYVNLRYFNVVGDAIGYVDPSPENVLPIIMEVVTGKRDQLTIFGDDYDTRDNSCVRDYIDVSDLVKAHILALELNSNSVINLGTSNGVTVKELIKYTEELIERKLPCKTGPRRKGDPAVVIASNEKAKKLLNWEPKVTIKDSIKSTYEAYLG